MRSSSSLRQNRWAPGARKPWLAWSTVKDNQKMLFFTLTTPRLSSHSMSRLQSSTSAPTRSPGQAWNTQEPAGGRTSSQNMWTRLGLGRRTKERQWATRSTRRRKKQWPKTRWTTRTGRWWRRKRRWANWEKRLYSDWYLWCHFWHESPVIHHLMLSYTTVSPLSDSFPRTLSNLL